MPYHSRGSLCSHLVRPGRSPGLSFRRSRAMLRRHRERDLTVRRHRSLSSRRARRRNGHLRLGLPLQIRNGRFLHRRSVGLGRGFLRRRLGPGLSRCLGCRLGRRRRNRRCRSNRARSGRWSRTGFHRRHSSRLHLQHHLSLIPHIHRPQRRILRPPLRQMFLELPIAVQKIRISKVTRTSFP